MLRLFGRVEAWIGKRGLGETHTRTLYRSLFGKFSQGIAIPEWSEETLPADLPKRIKADLARDFTMSSSRVVEQVHTYLRHRYKNTVF
jgi:hypothetical protein